MNHSDSTITIHMVCSLDGFIAKHNDDLSWMESQDQYDRGVTLTYDEITDFLSSIDCYVMGSKTYQQALSLGWPYGDVPVTVVSDQKLERERDTIQFYSGDFAGTLSIVENSIQEHLDGGRLSAD